MAGRASQPKSEAGTTFPQRRLLDTAKDWLFLIEAVTSHGPMSPKRIHELEEIARESSPNLRKTVRRLQLAREMEDSAKAAIEAAEIAEQQQGSPDFENPESTAVRTDLESPIVTTVESEHTSAEANSEQSLSLVESPVFTIIPKPNIRSFRPRKINFAAREIYTRSLGSRGEELVFKFERSRLLMAGRTELADRVTHISETMGDGAGYDILSFEEDGRERYIEVKTTTLGKNAPFLISVNELEFSEQFAAQFYLYRVFNIAEEPSFFVVRGSLKGCRLEPVQFRASFDSLQPDNSSLDKTRIEGKPQRGTGNENES